MLGGDWWIGGLQLNFAFGAAILDILPVSLVADLNVALGSAVAHKLGVLFLLELLSALGLFNGSAAISDFFVFHDRYFLWLVNC